MMSKLMPILAFALALALFFGYVDPMWNGSIATTKAAITRDDQALAAAAQYTAKQNELISAEKAIGPDALARLSMFLPDSADDVGLILDLDALAAKEGLALTGINVATPSGAPDTASQAPYSSVDLGLTASGSYGSFRSFLSAIESSARLLDIRTLSVTGSDTGVYTYAMTIRLYWLN